MGSLKALLIAGGVALAATSVAKAADLLPPAPPVEPVAPPMEFSGWYLRGDVGMALNMTTPKLTDTPNPLVGLPADAFNSFYNPTISGAGLFDIGVGYQFNSWLRFDVTGEYRGGSHFQALEQVGIPSTSTQFADFYRGSLSSYILMANGYVDLGTWYGVTPFVGAGIGWAQNHLDGVTDTGFAYIGPGATGSPTGGFFDNGTTNNFAWALMAGLDFDVTQNLKLELGYRYLSYGTAKTGASHCFNGTGAGGGFSAGSCGGSAHYISTDRLASSDFRLGLRWMISDVPTYAPPPPIVTKY
ncbi:MAG TPA: outer membrane beta-barrel protein [Roseiarcus sp.]|nr:outer membrane beta-barrel protein [Roseiarcus sp.]